MVARSTALAAFAALGITALPCIAPTALAEPLTAEQALEKTIAFHDPGDAWFEGRYHLSLGTTMANGKVREVELVIDNARGIFESASAGDGKRIVRRLEDETCSFSIDGMSNPSAEEVEKHNLKCDVVHRVRDYQTYLWGMPMKIRDPGARLDPKVHTRTFQGREVPTLRVTYDPEVGEDIWYFYLDPETFALVGYEFFKDEEKKIGEYIVFSDLVSSAGLRLPKNRAWYDSSNDTHLGTDSLKALESR